ncbi:MAG: DNA alkylation repair protein [Syntrophomonadaceae bacterium]|jgi:3-methyladenine DNA glycosylase AlkD|nr:DNA alkylation repair protein [Syntrophomonadaceae bacterium]
MLDELVSSFYAHKDTSKAIPMASYMKNSFPFLGISKPGRVQLEKEFIQAAKKQQQINWETVFFLWDLPEREFQYAAIDYLLALQKKLAFNDIHTVETLITSKSWWDTVDTLASNIVGQLCISKPELVNSHILTWAESNNIWLARTAILYQLKYKSATNTEILQRIISKNLGSKEFFINKAIGWMLREYSKTNQAWVKNFLDTHSLSSLSLREASKYL